MWPGSINAWTSADTPGGNHVKLVCYQWWVKHSALIKYLSKPQYDNDFYGLIECTLNKKKRQKADVKIKYTSGEH